MTSRTSTRASLQSPALPHRTPGQLTRRRRIERAIGLVAPALDLLLFVGDRVSRVAGRNEIPPDPPRRLSAGTRTAIGRPGAD
jgi:hypothetical protein